MLKRAGVIERGKLILLGGPAGPRNQTEELRKQLRAIASEVIDQHRELGDVAELSENSFLADIGLLAWQRDLSDFRARYPAGRGARDDPDSPAPGSRKPIIDRVRGLIGRDAKALLVAAKKSPGS